MKTTTTLFLTAEDGKILRHKETGLTTKSVWLRANESIKLWEEINEAESEVIDE